MEKGEQQVKIIIPCAGRGTRMMPDSKNCPKILLRHEGYPMLDWIVESILTFKPDSAEFIFVINTKLGFMIKDYIRENYAELNVNYAVQAEPLGFGHAVLQARDLVEDGEPVLIHACDKVLEFDGFDEGCSWMAVKKVKPPISAGVLKAEDGYITTIIEKPDLAWNAVCYIRETALLFESLQTHVDMGLRTAGEYQMTDALSGLINAGVKIRAKVLSCVYG